MQEARRFAILCALCEIPWRPLWLTGLTQSTTEDVRGKRKGRRGGRGKNPELAGTGFSKNACRVINCSLRQTIRLMETHYRILEIIACSLADALAAEAGGATRLEVIRRFDLGGLTPELERVREIARTVRLPLRVMLRESESFAVTDEGERDTLCRLAEEISQLSVNGLVLGFLRNRQVDVELLERVLACADGLRITFHRAFEEVANPLEAIAILKRYPQIDCILTSGGETRSWPEKARTLMELQQAAEPEITILAGGGLDLQSVEALASAATPIRAFHLGRAVRLPPSIGGEVSAAKVKEFICRLAG